MISTLFCLGLSISQTTAAIEQRLEQYRNSHNIPGLWVGASSSSKSVFQIALGKTWINGNQAKVTDAVSIGSISKYFLCDLATLCVLKGEVSWDAKVASVFSDMMGPSSPTCVTATLRQLILHEGGFPRDHIPWLDDPSSESDRKIWREAQIRTFTGLERLGSRGYQSPTNGTRPGQGYVYSNFGASVAGSMLERSSGLGLESLFGTRLFQPFGMKSASFGLPNPGAKSKSEPLGHFEQDSRGEWKPFTNWNDNPEPRSMAAAASGGLKMSIADLLNYLSAKCNFRFDATSPLPKSEMASLWHAGMEQDSSSGAVGGYRAWFKMNRKRRVVVAYICNANLTEAQAKELEGFLGSL